MLFYFDVVCYTCWMLMGLIVIAPRFCLGLLKSNSLRFFVLTCAILLSILVYFSMPIVSIVRGLWSSPSWSAFSMTLILTFLVLQRAGLMSQFRFVSTEKLSVSLSSRYFKLWLGLYFVLVFFVQLFGLNELFELDQSRLMALAVLSTVFIIFSMLIWKPLQVMERRVIEALLVAWIILLGLLAMAAAGLFSLWQISSALLLWSLQGFCFDVFIPIVLFGLVLKRLKSNTNSSRLFSTSFFR
jgi:hypothetical protein